MSSVTETMSSLRVANSWRGVSGDVLPEATLIPLRHNTCRRGSGNHRAPGRLLDACCDRRGLVLNNCLTCHSFVRFVLLQRTPEQWAYTRRTMRPQVPHLSDAEADRLFGYLEQHFNDHRPVP